MDTLRISELDLTRAGIISVQRTLPEGRDSWQVDYEVGGTLYRIQGDAIFGRPHGVDSDVLLALQTLFFRAGCPPNDRMEVYPSEILELTTLANSGKSYQRLRDGLVRLSGVKWKMLQSSWDEKRQKNVGSTSVLGLISELRLLDTSGEHRPFEDRQLEERLPIEVVFSPTFADSIRAGLYQMLDAELLSRLTQPPTRSLYRVIQAHRVQKNGSLTSELQVPLRDWVRACGIEEGRVGNARRVLELSHTQLQEQGYLKAAEFSGRGFNGTVTYRFNSLPQPALTELLMKHGVSRPVAESLSADYPERIPTAVRLVEEKIAAGWKARSLSASLVDAVKEPGKWGYAAPQKDVKAPPKKKQTVTPDEAPLDLKTVVESLMKVKLGRPLSPMAQDALDALTEEGLQAIKQALMKPKSEALPLVQALLSAPL
ncbi:replication initiator protein A [Deinococcus fonticola]|uniref:replication initiator protein A n=1 Tax=Deinococcus fonticola TaxID=2528713 RepID=UPI00107551CC|nr:replication initiator protein A [Deinococcus fonticola]